MFTLVLLVLLVWVVLTVVLAGWSLFLQQYLYTEATPGIAWRGPAAGAALTFVLLRLAGLRLPERRAATGRCGSSARRRTRRRSRRCACRRRRARRSTSHRPGKRNDYHLNGQTARPGRCRAGRRCSSSSRATSARPSSPSATRRATSSSETSTRFGRESKEPLRYIDETGRVMVEGVAGPADRSAGPAGSSATSCSTCLLRRVLRRRCGCCLGFQWPHALGQAFVRVGRRAAVRLAAGAGPGREDGHRAGGGAGAGVRVTAPTRRVGVARRWAPGRSIPLRRPCSPTTSRERSWGTFAAPLIEIEYALRTRVVAVRRDSRHPSDVILSLCLGQPQLRQHLRRLLRRARDLPQPRRVEPAVQRGEHQRGERLGDGPRRERLAELARRLPRDADGLARASRRASAQARRRARSARYAAKRSQWAR